MMRTVFPRTGKHGFPDHEQPPMVITKIYTEICRANLVEPGRVVERMAARIRKMNILIGHMPCAGIETSSGFTQ